MQMTKSYEITEFGKLCKSGRAPFGMTRFEMAKKLRVSSIDVSDIESGNSVPSEGYVCAVTGLLALPADEVKRALAKDRRDREADHSQPIARP